MLLIISSTIQYIYIYIYIYIYKTNNANTIENQQSKISLGERTISNLRFADDIDFLHLADTESELQSFNRTDSYSIIRYGSKSREE